MIETRAYGSAGPPVLVLHGGPGAAGTMAPVARALASGFRVIEPLQRGSGGEPLTVARHVADLDEVLDAHAADGERPALVGHSWGAMLALAYAAEHPGRVSSLVLVGCGTFDTGARARLVAVRDERLGARRDELERLTRDIADPDERLAAMGDLVESVATFDEIDEDPAPVRVDARAHEETWNDMLRRQAAGDYPAAFRSITVPVLMLHGAYDPHPGRMIRDGLAAVLPRLEYHEWERCGHTPWRERAVRDDFFARLERWLARHAGRPAAGC